MRGSHDHRRAPVVIGLLTVAVVLAVLVAAPSAAAPQSSPTPSEGSPGIPPPGANDPDCEPTDARPHPVVLVHGTSMDMTSSWNLLSPLLTDRGHCVFALDYGQRATGDIAASAAELAEFVGEVLEVTGAERVSIVGHSQGGMMPRYYLRFLGGTDHVADLVGLSPSNHGTTTPLAPLTPDCPACRQQIAGSDFLTALNRGSETWGPVSYTQIQTRHDLVVTPYESAFLEDGRRTTNVLLQDACPASTAEHVGMTHDPVVAQWVVHTLERPGPADPDHRPACVGALLAVE